jgi:hypothetical protein
MSKSILSSLSMAAIACGAMLALELSPASAPCSTSYLAQG